MFLLVVPTYNRAELLKRCLGKIQSQTFKNYRVLVLDDCSKDNTKEVVESFLSDDRFSYYKFEVNNGHSDKVMMSAISLGMLDSDWIITIADDEYFYTNDHLEKVANIISKYDDINLVAVEQGYDYGDIPLLDNDRPRLPEYFTYDMLSCIEKSELRKTIKNIFKRDLIISSGFFDTAKQGANDVVFEGEGGYLNLYPQAKMAFVPNVTHIFGVVPSARRKYLDFYMWIVSVGMTAYQAKNKELFYELLKIHYSSSYPIFLNTFFSWGGDGLALMLKDFYTHKDFHKIIREIAKIYNDSFKDRFLELYEEFNNKLPTINERNKLLETSTNIVLYPENSWRAQIQDYLQHNGKNILFVADDYKEGYKRYGDILENSSKIDCVFITSGHPKIVYNLLNKLDKFGIKVATLILKDDI
ncbi:MULTISPECIES: glycosyltransferase family 2 protein [Helicobacter]|uniref:Glycosyltransferase n=1 Tax=Helicobacter ibis TaxID=2962633 RepID=A0ABT4VDQ2_9HELI|nr:MULTISPECIES: glycosyltransferase [Helicobacter]MDA3967549.1 glycosyltransferase [Helicobacter sp. WB40]MDA3968298.1 glycosyltransferase [Helicobacter ibis]